MYTELVERTTDINDIYTDARVANIVALLDNEELVGE